MTDMPNAAHAKPRDHLWVVFVIAAAAAIEVCATWVGIGNVSGFPVIGLPFRLKVNTDFSLMVGMEAYGGFALYYWLSAAPGPRSRAFAMWSAAGALVLSLVGQVAYHVLAAEHVARPPAGVVGFVSSLPVVVLGFAAILMHLVHLDREGADRTAREAAEAARLAAEEAVAADERTALRAELEALKAGQATDRQSLLSDLEAARNAQEDAEKRAGEALTRAEKLAAKLEAVSAQRKRGKDGQRERKSAHDSDITTEFRALDEMEKDPSLRGPRMGAELARRLKVSEATGRRLHGKLTARDGAPESLTEHPADPSGERSDERS